MNDTIKDAKAAMSDKDASVKELRRNSLLELDEWGKVEFSKTKLKCRKACIKQMLEEDAFCFPSKLSTEETRETLCPLPKRRRLPMAVEYQFKMNHELESALKEIKKKEYAVV